ncbi:E1A/CREB-binding protein [Mytilus galloprovincialis]|uniref:E1A/CREB-binding protein n=1 Tax=Mytilus galloprovincialis TaxID=29158 RepID=A0A8B6GZY1_MYTGA|nr:E1A/CREB-binding protein [Mytilus galloprovincialis]
MDVNNSTINDAVGDSTETILGEINTAKILNKDITEPFQKNVFQQGVVIGKEKFPNLNWDLYDQVVLRTKVNRVVEKVKNLRKNNKAKLNSFLEQDFHFPVKKPVTSSFEYLQENERKRVKEIEKERNRAVGENVKLKRQLKETDFNLDNLELQIEHFETKSHILLRLLDIAGEKCKETLHLKRECKSWEKKYDNLSNQLDTNLDKLQDMNEQLASFGPRNTSRKIRRRDQKIEKLEGIIDEKQIELGQQNVEIKLLNKACEKNVSDLDKLKKDKRSLLVKVCRMSKQQHSSKLDQIREEHVFEIQNLKADIAAKQDRILELEDLNSILADDKIESFYDGKFSNEVRETIMTLLTECGVSQKKVNNVISIVLKNLTGKQLSRLPSAGVKSRLLIEAKRVAQKQVAEAMLNYEYDLPDVNDMGQGHKGNCLHQDATSKHHKHFQSFQITTPDKKTFSLGLNEVGSGDAASIMSSFKNIISDLGQAAQNEPEIVSRLTCSIVSTMSDQGAANPLFNQQLKEFKESLLPDIVENWENLDINTQTEMAKMSSFFCKMHIFVNMASEVDKCLQVFESNVCNGKNPFAFEWKESGASRLTRTASKALTLHGCEKSGVGQHFRTHLKERDIDNKLITFRGHRFNHLFYAAGATYHHLNDIIDFMESWADPNDLLKSISFDVREKAFASGIRALGIIDKLITGPFWRIIETSKNILDLNPTLCHLQKKLQELSFDASPLLAGELVFEGVEVHRDSIFDSLLKDTGDPVSEMYTQMALELCIGGMLLILERQAKDQLPGGKFFEPSFRDQIHGISVPTTNTCSERDFAQLDMLVRLKPSATTVAYESIIMWSNNKTSNWLSKLSDTDRNKIIDDARVSAPHMIQSFKTRQQILFNKKLEILRAKKEKKANKENKEYTQKVKLTGQLNELGGMWVTPQQIECYKVQIEDKPTYNVLFKEALIAQLQFRKHVIKSKGPKELYQQSCKGKQYSIQQLESNLKEVIELNKQNENVAPVENKLQYLSLNEVNDNISKAKQALAHKLNMERKKITVSQQSYFLPKFIETPELLVGKTFQQKCKEEDSNEISGKVLSIHKLNGKKTEYLVKYDIDENDEWHFPLFVDMSNGDLIIADL